MSTHCIFKLASRPYGDGYTTYAQIVCGWCDHAEWHVARDSGLAVRVFRGHGWKVGNKPNQHRCPLCFTKARLATRTPDNPALPREIGKALKAKLKAAQLQEPTAEMPVDKKDLMGSVAPEPMASSLVVERPPAPPVATPLPGPPPEPAPAPPVALRKAARGQNSIPGETYHATRENAAAAGNRATGTVDGDAFYTMPLGPGWGWKLACNVTQAEIDHWRDSRTYKSPRPIYKQRKEPPVPEPIKPQATVTPLRKDPMPTQATAPADRQPTRDERSAIHDALTAAYDIVDQRYIGSHSDKTLAAQLNMPRMWVTDVRVMFFGDHDRNGETEKQKQRLDVAIALATNATKRLLEMAGEAETIERDLIAARQKLGV